MAKTETITVVLVNETIKGGTPEKPETFGPGDEVTVAVDLGNRLIARKRAVSAPTKKAAAKPAAEPATESPA